MPRTRDLTDLAGILHDPDRPRLTIEEMKEAAAEGWASRARRGLDPDPDDEQELGTEELRALREARAAQRDPRGGW